MITFHEINTLRDYPAVPGSSGRFQCAGFASVFPERENKNNGNRVHPFSHNKLTVFFTIASQILARFI